MKKKVLPLITGLILILSILPLTADDGSWSNSFSIAGGSIYAEEDNGVIALEKELLTFNGRETRAVFQFRNTSSRSVRVECGFPVTHRIQSYMKEWGLSIPSGKYGENIIPGIVFFETLPHPWIDIDEPFFEYPEIIPVTDFNNSREFISPSEARKAGIEFLIFQNRQKLEVETVLLERQADEEGAVLTFHFKHDLFFEPGESSTVEVVYTQDLLFGSNGPGLFTYRWEYIIGTGGTWKGPIGEFVFLKPADWEGEIPDMDPTVIGIPEKGEVVIDIYYARDYEPARETRFSLRHSPISMEEYYTFFENLDRKKAMWTDRYVLLPPPGEPAQSFVRDVTASSELTDTFDIYTDLGVVREPAFGPLSAVDGYAESAWSEAAPGNGEGEYLSLRLTEPVDGLVIHNGFTRFPAPDWAFDGGFNEENLLDAAAGLKNYYIMNNRVKVLEILDENDDSRGVLELEDKRGGQTFLLPRMEPGTYRFVIREVYPGTRWDDTCLGEMTFLQAENRPEVLDRDRFFKDNLQAENF